VNPQSCSITVNQEGVGPVSYIPERTRHASTLIMVVVTMASSRYGHFSAPGKSIYLTGSLND
jgi:hypothetical protein